MKVRLHSEQTVNKNTLQGDSNSAKYRIEVDETYLGGLEEGVRGRETFKKALVVIAAQENGNGIGRIRMRRIPDASTESLLSFVGSTVEPGCVIHTDGWSGYSRLKEKGYTHEVTVLNGSKESANKLLPRVHRVGHS